MLQVIFVLIFTFTICRGLCPEMCLCNNYPRENVPKTSRYFTSVTCNGFSTNATFENTTRVVKFRQLNYNSVEELVITLIQQNLTFLNELIITQSDFSGNVTLVFDGLNNIFLLSLTKNNIQNVPDFFSNETINNLSSIDISNNNITLIQNTSFRTLQKLEVLNLSENFIINIDVNSFSVLNNLKYLDLSRNNLKQLKDNVLLPLSSLQYLNLSNNHLEALNELCFNNLVMLQQLDVSWNRLAKVAPGSLQLPSLARLLLAGNPKLGVSREVLVSTGRRLQTVDASRTGLKQVPAALTHSIRTLRLAGNSIKGVTCGELDSYPLLQLLDFTSNAIVSIEDDALGRLNSLSVLFLTDNIIQDIPKSLPEELTVLHLEHNRVGRVSRDDLLGLRDLEVLLLSDNKITVVEEGAFVNLIALVTIDLSRNPLNALLPGSFSGPRSLQVLKLSSIDSVSPAQDTSFPVLSTEHLISLDLSASPGLTRQFLADTAALASSRELQELDISNTNLNFLRSDLLFYLPQLRKLHVKNNLFNCTNLYWLATWMRRQDDKEYKNIVCSSPAELLRTPVVDLQQNNVEMSSIQSINQERLDSKTTINLLKETVTVSGIIGSVSEFTTAQSIKNVIQRISKKTFFLNLDNGDHHSNKNTSQHNLPNKTYTVKSANLTRKDNSNPTQNKNSQKILNDVLRSIVGNTNRNKTSFITKVATVNRIQSNRTTPKLNYSSLSAYSVYNNKTRNDETLDLLNLSTASETSTFNATLKRDPLSGKNSRNLNEEPFNATMDSTDWIPGDGTFTIDPNMTENSSQWNASTGEMSMYTNTESKEKNLYPGLLILAAGFISAVAILAGLATRFNKQKRNNNLFEEHIEVSSIPSVTELW